MNPLALATLTVNGAALDLGDVLADVTIRHGRTGFFDAASASTCQITLLGVDRALTSPFRLGALLVVNATDGSNARARFVGRFTDATLVDDVLTAIAVGALRTLPGYELVNAYPQERWSSRVIRAFAEAGLAPVNGVTNSDLEAGVAPWVGWSTGTTQPVLSRSNDPTHVKTGSYALFMTLKNTDANNRFSMVWGNDGAPIPCSPGQRFRIRVYASGLAGLAIGVRNNGGGFDNPDNRPDLFEPLEGLHFTGYNGVQLGGIYTAPPGTTSIQLALGMDVPPGATYYAAADALELYPLAAGGGTLELELGPFDPLLVAEPAPSSTRTLGGYLDELAAMVGAAVADLPDGRILVQAIDSRKIGGAVALDPAEVGYAPEWSLRLPGANIVDVTYGEPASSVSARDPASVALYGPIAASVTTRFLNAVDAQAVANGRIASGAYSRWTVGDAPLLVGLALKIGTPVTLSVLPPAAPHGSWTPLLEGWTDRVVSDGERLEWTMELALSDPLLSGLVMPWNAVPTTAAYQWNTINQSTAWRDALSLDALDPA